MRNITVNYSTVNSYILIFHSKGPCFRAKQGSFARVVVQSFALNGIGVSHPATVGLRDLGRDHLGRDQRFVKLEAE